MQEPIGTNTAPSFPLLLSLLAVTIALSYLVVIMSRMPRTREEWVVSLITTIVGSIAGGAFIIIRFGLQQYANDWFGLCVLGGIIFASGLPFWAIARWTFTYINKQENADITEVIADIKNKMRGN